MKVLFICSGGMSSAITMKAFADAAAHANVDLVSDAVGSGEAQDAIGQGDWDMVLVAPQVRNRYATFKGYADARGIPIENIPPRMYSPLGGQGLLDLALKIKG